MLRLALFVVLSLSDLALTWWLLSSHSTMVYESNPIASFVLHRSGWPGLIIFKLAVIATVVLSCWYIVSRRPLWANSILNFGCLLLMAIVAYSGYLVHHAERSTSLLVELNTKKANLEAQLLVSRDHLEVAARLHDDLITDRLTLSEAVQRIQQTGKSRNAYWIKLQCEAYDCSTYTEAMAANLIQGVCMELKVRGESAASEGVVQRLRQQYAAAFGREVRLLPPFHSNPAINSGHSPASVSFKL